MAPQVKTLSKVLSHSIASVGCVAGIKGAAGVYAGQTSHRQVRSGDDENRLVAITKQKS